jgi:hypothetical protein
MAWMENLGRFQLDALIFFDVIAPGRHALCSDYAADGCELLYPGAALICNICAMCSCHVLSTPGPNQSRFDILRYLDIS